MLRYTTRFKWFTNIKTIYGCNTSYILSAALTLAGIPNRVMGFQSFLDYTILKRFRDYKIMSESVRIYLNITVLEIIEMVLR